MQTLLADVNLRLTLTLKRCLPEQADDGGAGEQSDEGQAVAQGGQDPHHPVEDQLDTQTQDVAFKSPPSLRQHVRNKYTEAANGSGETVFSRT